MSAYITLWGQHLRGTSCGLALLWMRQVLVGGYGSPSCVCCSCSEHWGPEWIGTGPGDHTMEGGRQFLISGWLVISGSSQSSIESAGSKTLSPMSSLNLARFLPRSWLSREVTDTGPLDVPQVASAHLTFGPGWPHFRAASVSWCPPT